MMSFDLVCLSDLAGVEHVLVTSDADSMVTEAQLDAVRVNK